MQRLFLSPGLYGLTCKVNAGLANISFNVEDAEPQRTISLVVFAEKISAVGEKFKFCHV
jgi:hypothetical protein